MNNNIQIDKLLDDILRGNINTSDEDLLRHNVTKDEIDLHRSAAVALQRYSVLQQVQRIHKEYTSVSKGEVVKKMNNKSRKLVSMPLWKLFIRLAAILILFVGGWFAYVYTTTNSTKLYAEIYQQYNINTDRNSSIGFVPDNMIEQFKDRDYPGVTNTFLSLPVSNTREKFLAAYAWHETGDYKQSINVLLQILKDNKQTGSRLYNDEAEFYLGLSYLKIKNNKLAFTYFEKIHNNINHTFHERVGKWTLTRLKWLKNKE